MDSYPENLPEPQEPHKTGLLDAMLDFSFSKAITPTIIKPLFILGLILSALAAISPVLGAFGRSSIMGSMLALVFAPVLFFVYAVLTRVFLEIVVVLFRIADHLRNIDNKTL